MLGSDTKGDIYEGILHGNEIVAGTRRLCLMNLFLHTVSLPGFSTPRG